MDMVQQSFTHPVYPIPPMLLDLHCVVTVHSQLRLTVLLFDSSAVQLLHETFPECTVEMQGPRQPTRGPSKGH